MKGIVMESHGKKAAVLLKDGTFRIVRGKYSVGDAIEYHETNAHSIQRWVAAAAVVLLLGTGGGIWYDANLVAYGEISLDVNPSIIYTVNKRSQVLDVRAGNENASVTVDALTHEGIRFMPVSDAIEMTIGILGTEGYMDTEKEDYVLVNISADGDMMQSRLTDAVEEGIGHAREKDPSMEFRIDHSDRATGRRAAEYNMSPGRFAAWEQAGDGSMPEVYSEMTVREIMLGKPEETNEAIPGEFQDPETNPPPMQNEQLPDHPAKTDAQGRPMSTTETSPAPQFNNETPPDIPAQKEEPDKQAVEHVPSEGVPPSSEAGSQEIQEGPNQPVQNGKEKPDSFRRLQPENGTTVGAPVESMPEKPSGRPAM